MRWLNSVVAAALLASGLGAVSAAPATAATDAELSLKKEAPAGVLLGDPIPYTLTATNDGPDALYNVSFSDVLPAGFEYVGPTTPASAGSPKISTTPGGQTLLVWSNVTDLQVNSDYQIRFSAKPTDPEETIEPVDTNNATVAGEGDERRVPKFDSSGDPIPSASLVSYDDSAPTERLPFDVIKTNNNSSEGELLRGVHDQRSIYTLEIRNNRVVDTENITVTDFLPAGLEYLNCGDEDNTQPLTEVEYQDAPRLGVPPLTVDHCDTPVSVETVANPTGVPGYTDGDLTGVFTAVTYDVGTLAPGATKTIKYVAGIPLQANTMAWQVDGQPVDPPGQQGSNLNNNNGASTRELEDEASLVNRVSAVGTFKGQPEAEVAVTADHSVQIEDIRMRKAAYPHPYDPQADDQETTHTFEPGRIVDFVFTIDASEYMDGSGIVVTDLLPDGFCPLGSANYAGDDPACVSGQASPSPGYSSVEWDTDAHPDQYTVIFDPMSVNANGTITAILPAKMLSTYRATGKPTLAGDSFRNNVSLIGKTNPIDDVVPIETGEQTVGDESHFDLDTGLPTISKQMKKRAAPPTFENGMDCDPTAPPGYQDADTIDEADRRFRKGDIICFKLRVNFPANLKTRNAVVTDFPPVNTEFLVDSFELTAGNTVPVDQITTDRTATKLVITLGAGDTDKYVDAARVFEATFAVQVQQPAVGDAPEITGNLMKMRTVNTAGEAESYRDDAEFGLLPPPNLSIDKGVIATDKPAATFPPLSGKLQDNKPIEQGGTATFQINVANAPQIPGADYSVRGVQVWDRLPEQLTCSSVDMAALQYLRTGMADPADLPDGIATCEDDIIKWVFPTPDLAEGFSIAPEQTLSLFYTMKVPDYAAAGTNYANTAGVRQYEAFTDLPGATATYIPRDNIDPTQDDFADSPALDDPSNVFIPGVDVTKTGTTSLTETNNNTLTQATIGETITYTYSATVKKGTTVYRGVLSDALPTGIDFVSQVSAKLDGGELPAGFSAVGGTLTFPPTWANETDADQVFTVVITAKVGQAAAGCGNPICGPLDTVPASVPKENTVTFASFTAEEGGSPISNTAKYTVDIVQPRPDLNKIASPTSVTSTSTDITYTLTASTPGGRPPLHNVTVIDCIPDDLQDPTDITGGGTFADDTACGRAITWAVTKLDPGNAGQRTFTYKARIRPGSPANVTFRNTVGLTGTSMPGTVTGERTYTSGNFADVLITGETLEKSVTPSVATIGQTVTATIDTKLPDAEYKNLVVLDTLPPYIDNADISNIQLKCFTTDSNYQNAVACATPDLTATFLGPNPATPGVTGQKIGWSFGSLPDSDKHRIIRITYNSRVSNLPQNQAGVTRTNTAVGGYGYETKPLTLAQAQNPPSGIAPDGATLTLAEPNLAITKKVGGEDAITVTPDQEFEYTISVTNPQRAGGVPTSTAYAVQVRDCVPAGIVVVYAGSGTEVVDNSCPSTKAIRWPTIASHAVNAQQQYSYTARLASNTTTAQTNVVSALEWSSLPPDVSNPDIRNYGPLTADAEVTPALPDVQIVKSASDELAYIDQPYTWTIAVTNPSSHSPGPTAYDVSVDDVLPPNWTYTTGSTSIELDGSEVSTTDPTVDATDPLAVRLTWDTGIDLQPNKAFTITFQAQPGADVVDDPGVGVDVTPAVPHVNTANTTWFPGDPEDGWDAETSEDVTAQTHIAKGDLKLTKTHVTDYDPDWNVAEDQIVPGTTFKWKFEVKSIGPDPFVGPYVVTDVLPAGLEYRGFTPNGWSCDQDPQFEQDITCSYGNEEPDGLAAGDSLPFLFIEVYVDLDAPTDMTNAADVTGRTYDSNLANNHSEDTVYTRDLADVAIEKSSSGRYVVGEQVEYTLAVTNLGPSTSSKPITVTDTLPSGLSIVSYDAAPWSCSPASGPATTVTCVLNQDLLPQTQAVPIRILADVVESPGESAQNCAVVTPTTEDQFDGNNESCVTDPVTNVVQLGIAKRTTGANPVVAGESTEFTVTVTNQGPSEAKNVQMQDVLEPGLRATSATGKGWTCDVGTGTIVTCTRKTFPVKDSPSDIVIKADTLASVPGGTTLKNTATVTTTSPQENGDPDPATSTVDVIAKSDLAIEKAHQSGPWTIGKQGVWQLKVTNAGPSDNPGPLTVTDQLPRGNEFVSASGDSWGCTASGRAVTCVRQTGLIVGQSSEFTIRVDVVTGAWPEVVNRAEVTSPLPDTNPDNNLDTDQVQVERAKQTADKLPQRPTVLPAKTTKEGQRIRTKVRCSPLKSSAAGEASYCKVNRSKNGTIRIKVVGGRPVRVTLVQYAKGNKEFKPWKRVKRYILRP